MGWLDILKIVAVAIAAGAAVTATVVIAKKITAARLKAKVAEDFANAIKLKIKDKSTKTVDVGIFGANNQLIAEKLTNRKKEFLMNCMLVRSFI